MDDENLQREIDVHIEEIYAGNAERYVRDTLKSTEDSIDWATLCASEEIFPELAEVATNMIGSRLGYLPRQDLMKTHELHVRTLIHRYTNDVTFTKAEFQNSIDMHIKHIRNADMRFNDIIVQEKYTEADLESYSTKYLEVKELAQKKIKYMLGYSPSLMSCLEPELYFRKFLSDLKPKDRSLITAIDYRVAGMIKYREAYLIGGIEAANVSPLMGIPWDTNGIDPINRDFQV